MTTKAIKQLEAIAKSFIPPKTQLLPKSQNLEIGQVYHIGSDKYGDLTVVVHEIQDPFVNVYPIFDDTHMAGPEDVLLPKEIFGHRKVISPYDWFTIRIKDLKKCLGKLPPLNIKKMQKGIDYLDINDIRYDYHLELTDRYLMYMINAHKEIYL